MWYGQSICNSKYCVAICVNDRLGQQCTLWTIPSRAQTLYNAWPRRSPLWAVFIWVKPKSASCWTHSSSCTSSIQWPVTAKYASAFDACQASQVRLIAPLTTLLWSESKRYDNRKDAGGELTLSRSLRAFICSLNIHLISFLVCFRDGSLRPRVARAAMLTIFWKAALSNAWIGYIVYEKRMSPICLIH